MFPVNTQTQDRDDVLVALSTEIIGLFNGSLNTFLLMVISERERELFYLTTHSTHFMFPVNTQTQDRDDVLVALSTEIIGLFNDSLNTFLLMVISEREREMFYLTTHTTHFMIPVNTQTQDSHNVLVALSTEIIRLFNDTLNTFLLTVISERERNVLFNDALNTFYVSRQYTDPGQPQCSCGVVD